MAGRRRRTFPGSPADSSRPEGGSQLSGLRTCCCEKAFVPPGSGCSTGLGGGNPTGPGGRGSRPLGATSPADNKTQNIHRKTWRRQLHLLSPQADRWTGAEQGAAQAHQVQPQLLKALLCPHWAQTLLTWPSKGQHPGAWGPNPACCLLWWNAFLTVTWLHLKCLFSTLVHNVLDFASWPTKPKMNYLPPGPLRGSHILGLVHACLNALVLHPHLPTTGFCSKHSVLTLGIHFLKHPKQSGSQAGHRGRPRAFQKHSGPRTRTPAPKTWAAGVQHRDLALGQPAWHSPCPAAQGILSQPLPGP